MHSERTVQQNAAKTKQATTASMAESNYGHVANCIDWLILVQHQLLRVLCMMRVAQHGCLLDNRKGTDQVPAELHDEGHTHPVCLRYRHGLLPQGRSLRTPCWRRKVRRSEVKCKCCAADQTQGTTLKPHSTLSIVVFRQSDNSTKLK